MILTRLSLGNPIAVFVGILLVCLLGGISLGHLPIQLTPEVQEPEITIRTNWRAAAPNEVEAEIIEPQEAVLRGLPGMTELRTRALEGRAEINITFAVDMDMRRALIEVINRLNQVADYPADADEPTIDTVGADARAIAWFIITRLPDNDRDIASYQDYVEEIIQARFERIPGVARSEIYGGREREIRITFDPYRLASLGVILADLSGQAGSAKDTSAGSVDMGKREYHVRFSGKYSIADLETMILAWRDGRPIYLRDVATIKEQLADRSSFVITNDTPSIAINAQRESGVNVLTVMAALKKAAAELNAGPLAQVGLAMHQFHDETIYIRRSIEILRNNLGFGIALSITILWLFLLRFRATLMVAISIPICLLASFTMMYLLSRTLNVISLAGLALATGMVLDASIIVLESIFRLREQGLPKEQASIQGTTEVWGALLASTVTTIAIFLPIVFLRNEAGQLFADLAITITSAIGVSLLSAIIVVPTATRLYLTKTKITDPYTHLWQYLTQLIMRLTDTPIRRLIWIVCLVSLPLCTIYMLKPKADYLPNGNLNLVVAFIVPPPGANIDTMEKEMGQLIAQRLAPHLEGTAQPVIRHYFFVIATRGVFLGMRAIEDNDVKEVVSLANSIVQGLPDAIAFARQISLFQGFSAGRSIDMNIQGRDLATIMQAAFQAFITLPEKLPGASVRPQPGLVLAQPELRLRPNDRRIAEAGWDRATMSKIINTFGDGLFVGDYFNGEKTLDIIVRATAWDTIEDLLGMPLATPHAGVLPLGELVDVVRTAGPEQILRVNRRRTVTLQISPPETMSLEEALELIRIEIEPQILSQLPEDGGIEYTGVADKLKLAISSMIESFLLAIAILYLLISAIFRSFKDSLLVLLSVPLATVGGILALAIMNLFTTQNMDLLTMIGFVILLGLVVNNAILLVHRTRLAERQGQARRQAVEQAIRVRVRPIMMSTLTSIFAALPLLLIPGAGTELYRGLAAVIVGGMLVSAVFTLLLLPSLLRVREERHSVAGGG